MWEVATVEEGRDFPTFDGPRLIKQFLSTAPRAGFRAADMATNLSRERRAFGMVLVCEGGVALPRRVGRLLLA